MMNLDDLSSLVDTVKEQIENFLNENSGDLNSIFGQLQTIDEKLAIILPLVQQLST